MHPTVTTLGIEAALVIVFQVVADVPAITTSTTLSLVSVWQRPEQRCNFHRRRCSDSIQLISKVPISISKLKLTKGGMLDI